MAAEARSDDESLTRILERNPPPKINKIDLLGEDSLYQCFLLENVLSEEECEAFIKVSEASTYDSLEALYPKDYRDNDRVMITSEGTVAVIWEVRNHK